MLVVGNFLFLFIHKSSTSTMNIAIQGILGSFHDIAARRYFGDADLDMICCDTFEAVFEALSRGTADLGLVAIENTIAGSLLHNYELLLENEVTVVGEHKLHIAHALMCLPDHHWATLTEVNSHPVALMQCRHYLARHPQLKVVETHDTAGAAADIAREKRHGHAAVCHADAARRYGLKLLERGIEDNKHNFTRFLVVRNAEHEVDVPGVDLRNKAMLVFTLPHEEGALARVLSIISFYKINLTKIQSLPIIGHEWQYRFYVDLTYDDNVRYLQCVEALRPLTLELKILGEYTAC